MLKEEEERNRWPVVKIIAANKGNDGFVWSASPSNKVDLVAQCFERLVSKLVILVENDEKKM